MACVYPPYLIALAVSVYLVIPFRRHAPRYAHRQPVSITESLAPHGKDVGLVVRHAVYRDIGKRLLLFIIYPRSGVEITVSRSRRDMPAGIPHADVRAVSLRTFEVSILAHLYRPVLQKQIRRRFHRRYGHEVDHVVNPVVIPRDGDRHPACRILAADGEII